MYICYAYNWVLSALMLYILVTLQVTEAQSIPENKFFLQKYLSCSLLRIQCLKILVSAFDLGFVICVGN